MAPAAHLWQVGLLPAIGKTCYVVVAPVGGSALTAFYASAQSTLAALGFAVLPPPYRHVTLCSSSPTPFDIDPPPLPARAARMLEIEATPYSFRIIPNQSVFGEMAERLGLPPSPRQFGMTLAYATRANDARTIALIKDGLQRALPLDAHSVFSVEAVQQWRMPTPRAFGREVVPMKNTDAP